MPMDIFLSFEQTRYDIWVERFTLNIHCGIVVIEISIPHRLRPSQAPHNQRSGTTSDDGEREVQRARP
jgi:hypothetical protein